jgi:MFS family permease
MAAESSDSSDRTRTYSIIGFGYAASGVLAATLAGFTADRWGFYTVFVLGLFLEALCLAMVARFAVETLNSTGVGESGQRRFGTMLRSLFTLQPQLRSFYLATTMDSFVWGLGAGIFYGMLRQTFHFSPAQFGLLSSISSLAWTLSQLPLGRLIQKHGRIKFMVISELLGAAMMAGWLFSSHFGSFPALQVLSGLVPATWLPAILAWISDHVRDDQRAEEMGRLRALRGLLSFPGPYIGGLVFERWGFSGPILLNMLGALAVAFVLWKYVPEDGDSRADTEP